MKKKLKAFGIRSIASILTIVMVFNLLPLSVFAQENDSPTVVDESYKRLNEVFEVEELREETVKHFRLEDGSFVAAQYNNPVHYLDDNGQWQNIDNSLTIVGNEYTTGNGKIKFAKKITGNEELFTLHDGNHKVTMSMDNADKKTEGSIVKSKADDSDELTQLQKMMTLENLTAEVIYADILPGVDLQYVVESGIIKENIIVKQRQSNYNYAFTIKLNNLHASLREDGSVLIFDPDTEEVCYFIPAPVVYDADSNIADSVAFYTLTQTGNNTYSLSISVDAAWMNAENRAYPVTIDPPVYPMTGKTVVDTYVNSYSPTNAPELVEYLYAGNTTHLYWKSTQMPTLPNDAYITNAEFSLKIMSVPSGSYTSYMGIFPVLTDWDESLCWNDYVSSTPKGDFDENGYTDFNVVSVTNGETDSNWLTWNVTSIVKGWYSGRPNYGITVSDINNKNESYSARNIQFHSNGDLMATRPKLCISYQDMRGIEDYWTTTSQNVGIAGVGHVNHATGDLSFVIGTISSTDSLMPYTPTLTYNSAIADYPNIYSEAEVPYLIANAGFGFKWSMSETIVERTYPAAANATVTYYVWADADGTEHYFTPCLDANGNTVYKDEDGLHLTLKVNTSSYTITDASNTVRTFTRNTADSSYLKAGGVLTTITDVNGNYISFNPNNWGRNTSITLVPYGGSAITSFKITHNASAKVNRILNEVSQEAAIFYYSTTYNGTDISPYNGGYLRKIVYAHQEGSTEKANWDDFMQNGSNANIIVDATATYTYNSDGRLITARDELSGYEVNYGYTNGKVTSIREKAGASSTVGQQILLSYYDNYTEVRTSGKDDCINNGDDIITRYVFDNSGRTITAYSVDVNGTTIYGATSGKYNEQSESKNSIRVSSYVSDSAANYLMNGGFENATPLNYWYSSNNVTSTKDNKYEGVYGAALTSENGQTSQISQFARLSKGPYTLSLNVKTDNCAGADVQLIAKSLTTGALFTETVPVDQFAASGNYAFASLNFEVTGENEDYQIIIQITSTSATSQTLYVDNVMLAKSIGVSAYNMVELGNFEDCSLNSAGAVRVYPKNRWSRTDEQNISFEAPDVGEEIFGQSLKIVGSLDSVRGAYLNVFNATSPNDLNTPKIFKISGFAKANKQMSNSSSRFALKVDVAYYNETERQTYWFDFANTSADQWQFTSGTFEVCANGGAVKTISVSCVYNYQPAGGVAYFDNISVVEVKDGSVETYTYYDSGMPKTYHNGSYQEWYYYADNNTSTNLTKKITSTNGITEYTYDARNRIIQEVYSEYEGTFAGDESAITITPRTKTTYTYNSYGLLTNTTVRTVQYSGTSLVDTAPANVLSSSKTYNTAAGCRHFGSLATETDTLGQITRYFYDDATGRLTAVINPDQRTGLVYTYDSMGNITLVQPASYTSSTVSSVTDGESAAYTYENGRLETIVTGSSAYKFTYDVFGNNTEIEVGDRNLATYEYGSGNGKLAKITYGNGFVVNYVYDELDRIESIQYNNTIVYQYTYDANGNLCKLVDHASGRTYRYKYDDRGRLVGFYESTGSTNTTSATNVYDEQDRLHLVSYSKDYALTSSAANLTTSYQYDYTDTGNLEKLTMTSGNATYTYTPSYDALDRVASSSAVLSTPSGLLTNEIEYTYKVGSNSNQSLQVYKYHSWFGSNEVQYTYGYDSNGNITHIFLSTGENFRYVYDDIGQLVREDNSLLNRTFVYTYDDAGNILSKRTYALTAAGVTPTTLYSTYSYGYDDSWGDLLTSYRGVSFTYDEIGNPLTYYNGSTYRFTWENGRRLTTASVGSNDLSFTYNHDGIRTSKTVNGVVHNYTVSGSLILTEEWGTNLVVYLYDANGAPIGMRYRTSSMAEGTFYTFWFDKNLQGDVVAVYNETGTKVLSYSYDAWGNKTTTVHNGSGTNGYAQYNAITYRGYYFDSETNLYYVSSRYYDAVIGRFINGDAIGLLGANGDFASLNMFAYCGNNPVSREDEGGEFWHIVIGAAVGAAVSFASSVISDIVSGEKIDWAGAGISAAFGAASGALAATGLGAVAQVAGGAVLAGAENVIEQGRKNGFENIDYGEVAVSSIVGGVTSRNNGVSKDASNHLYKQAAVATKRLKATRRHGGVTSMMKAMKPTIKYYFSQTNTLFYKPLINDSVSTLVSNAKDSIRDSLYITAS